MALFHSMMFMLFMILVSPSQSSSFLRVPPNKFVDSAKEVSTILQQLHSILSPLTNTSGLPNDIHDCLDLLDMSSEQLRMSMSATQNPKAGTIGNLLISSELRTRLSAVLVNSVTCIEGLEGLEVKGVVSTGLYSAMSLVDKNLLAQVIPVPRDQLDIDNRGFPSWINQEDKKMLRGNRVTPDVVVATDGSGHYRNVMEAVLAAPDYSNKKKICNRNKIDGWSTFRSATFAVDGARFIACNISFKNTAGPVKHQAVALRSSSHHSIFFRCGIFGYQDSLYAFSMIRFYKECTIAGTIDFICGDATAVFQDCRILAKKGLPKQQNVVTAQSRTNPKELSGFSFQFCKILADADLLPYVGTIPTYLGRPWKAYSRTIFMESYLSKVVSPAGWMKWEDTEFALNTLTYGEYKNYGPGAKLANRVKWRGYRVLKEMEAKRFTVAEFIDGNIWLPSTGVNYTSGL
ncbi:pectinesterase [Trifolium repens]|nr:pectinesterase [Trifolium repens]